MWHWAGLITVIDHSQNDLKPQGNFLQLSIHKFCHLKFKAMALVDLIWWSAFLTSWTALCGINHHQTLRTECKTDLPCVCRQMATLGGNTQASLFFYATTSARLLLFLPFGKSFPRPHLVRRDIAPKIWKLQLLRPNAKVLKKLLTGKCSFNSVWKSFLTAVVRRFGQYLYRRERMTTGAESCTLEAYSQLLAKTLSRRAICL